jgi:hypothetical protein
VITAKLTVSTYSTAYMLANNLVEVYEEQLVVELQELLTTNPSTKKVEKLLGKYGYHQDLAYKLQRTKKSIGL